MTTLIMRKILLFFMITMFVFSCRHNAEMYYKKAQKEVPYDVIIVPGVPYGTNEDWADKVMRMRVYWAALLFKKGYAKNVIFSGSAVYTPYLESDVFAQYAVQLGIPKEHIYLESYAEHSTENLYYSCKLAKLLGFKKIALATDPFQSKLLQRYAMQKFIKVSYIPAIMDSIVGKNIPDPIIDSTKSKVENFVSLTERQSFFKRFRGTLGFHVNKKYYSKLDSTEVIFR